MYRQTLNVAQMKNFPAYAFLIFFLAGSFLNCTDDPPEELPPKRGLAVITSFNGKVTINAPDQEPYEFDKSMLYTSKGMAGVGTILSTGPDGKLDLQFSTGILLRLGEDTKVLIEEAEVRSGDDFSNVILDLKKGKLFSKIAKIAANTDYQVKSPSSVALVRGTEFINIEDIVVVGDGSVEVTKPDGSKEKLVQEGEKAESTETDITVSEASDEELALIDEFKSDLNPAPAAVREKIESIREQFEKKQEEIREKFEEQKEKNREALEEQREKNREAMEEQRDKNREEFEGQKQKNTDAVEEKKSELQGEVSGSKDEAKNALDRIKENRPGKTTIDGMLNPDGEEDSSPEPGPEPGPATDPGDEPAPPPTPVP